MSHFTTIPTRVRDIDALRDASRELGLQALDPFFRPVESTCQPSAVFHTLAVVCGVDARPVLRPVGLIWPRQSVARMQAPSRVA